VQEQFLARPDIRYPVQRFFVVDLVALRENIQVRQL
jgi:hypothetical protein